MKIVDVRTVLLTGPSTNDPYLNAYKRLRTAAFIEIHTDTELVGVGETYLGYHMPQVIPDLVEFYKPILVNGETLDIQRLRQRMIDCGMYWGRVGIGHTVIAGLEAALWDLKGKMYGVPVYELLGGKCHEQLPCYATGGASNWPLEKLLEKMDFYANLGFKGLKVGAGYHDPGRGQFGGKTLAENVEMEGTKAEAMRSHAGPGLKIAMDGHMGFRHGADRWTVPIAKAVLHAVEPYDIHFFEEPLAYVDPRGYAELAASTSIRVAGGEQLTAIDEWRPYIDVGAFDMAQPDAAWNGISDFLEIGRMMARRGGWVASHAWAAGGGTMQNIHAAFATPNTLILEIPPAAGPLHTEVWGDSFQMVDGQVLPPTAPGLGIRLSDDLEERFPYRTGAEEWVSVPGKICKN